MIMYIVTFKFGGVPMVSQCNSLNELLVCVSDCRYKIDNIYYHDEIIYHTSLTHFCGTVYFANCNVDDLKDITCAMVAYCISNNLNFNLRDCWTVKGVR